MHVALVRLGEEDLLRVDAVKVDNEDVRCITRRELAGVLIGGVGQDEDPVDARAEWGDRFREGDGLGLGLQCIVTT